jgi:hypothetical protein
VPLTPYSMSDREVVGARGTLDGGSDRGKSGRTHIVCHRTRSIQKINDFLSIIRIDPAGIVVLLMIRDTVVMRSGIDRRLRRVCLRLRVVQWLASIRVRASSV